jgi:hypothetical protein
VNDFAAELAVDPAAMGDEVHGTQKQKCDDKGDDEREIIIQGILLCLVECYNPHIR